MLLENICLRLLLGMKPVEKLVQKCFDIFFQIFQKSFLFYYFGTKRDHTWTQRGGGLKATPRPLKFYLKVTLPFKSLKFYKNFQKKQKGHFIVIFVNLKRNFSKIVTPLTPQLSWTPHYFWPCSCKGATYLLEVCTPNAAACTIKSFFTLIYLFAWKNEKYEKYSKYLDLTDDLLLSVNCNFQNELLYELGFVEK